MIKRKPSPSKTRKQWAAAIRADYKVAAAKHREAFNAVVKMGRTLNAAKDVLDYGEFLKMIERDLPFAASTAQRLMIIASDRRMLRNAQHLPKAWPTLYELTKLPDAAFNQAVASGQINPQMTRQQATRIRVEVGSRVAYTIPKLPAAIIETRRVAVPVYREIEHDDNDNDSPPMRLVASQPEPEQPSDVASLALAQIERLVGDLAMAVERGEIRADVVLEGRIRAVADRLLSLIERQHDATIN